MVALPEPMPVFILTGFLGSGKTTLLQRLLRAGDEVRTGVLINEFGEAGLDHRIVAHVAEANAVIANGCLCCSVRPELARGLLDLLRRSLAGEVARFGRLVIETSGLSDPAPIINTIQTHPVLKEHFRIARVITTVDALNGLASFDDHAEIGKQVAVADTIVITKTDLAAAPAVAALLGRIRTANPLTLIRDGRAVDFDVSSVFACAERDSLRLPTVDEGAQAHDVRTFSIAFEEAVDWSAFVTWLALLLNRHGREVLRLKGLLHVAGEQAPILVHGMQHIMHPPEHMPAWPDDDRRSQLVFIVRALEPDLIRTSLASFLRFAARPQSRNDHPGAALALRPRRRTASTLREGL